MSTTKEYTFPFQTIALDLDGTLLNKDKKVTPRTHQVLKQLADQGVNIILASGRAAHLIENTVDELTGVNCFIIGYNGTQGFSKKDSEGKRKMIFSDSLPVDRLRDIITFVSARNLMLNLYLDYEYAIDTPELRHFADHYAKLTGATYKFVNSYESLLPCEAPKVLIITEDEVFCDSLIQICEKEFPDLEIVKGRCHGKIDIGELHQFYVEFLPKGVDKGTALQKWCAATGASIDMTIAFGDAENDIGLLKTAKLGVCMKGSTEAVRAIAKLETKYTNDEDGVANELARIFAL